MQKYWRRPVSGFDCNRASVGLAYPAKSLWGFPEDLTIKFDGALSRIFRALRISS